jgi:hypothetical protein
MKGKEIRLVRDGSTYAEMIYLIIFSGLPLQGAAELDHRAHSDIRCLDPFIVADSWRKQKHVRLGWHYAVELLENCALQCLCSPSLRMHLGCTRNNNEILSGYSVVSIACC